MKCKDYQSLIALYVEGDLNTSEAVQVKAHINICSFCNHFHEQLRMSQKALRAFAVDELDDAILDDLRLSVMKQVSQLPTTTSFWRHLCIAFNWQYALASGFIIVIILSVTIYLLILRSTEKPILTKENTPAPYLKVPEKPDVEPDKGIKSPLPLPQKQARYTNKRIKRAKQPNTVEQDDLFSAPYREQTAITATVAKPLVEAVSAEPAEVSPLPNDKTRIELKTRDPNIRIIWFVNKEAGRSAS
ncbi:MAG: zf-HC2 domain-containing protein [Acidobacteriota bacterium]